MKNLTKKSRWMIYLSLFISGVVILSAVIYFVTAKDGVKDNKETLMLVIIIIIAVLAVASMLFSRLKLKQTTKNLSSEYFKVYEEISDKLNGLSMSNLEKKETLTDILDLFLLADKDQRNAEDVVGNSVDDFVNQIHSSFGYRSKFVFNFLTGVQYSILYIFMMQCAEFLKIENIGFFSQEVSISLLLLLLPLAFIAVPLMTGFIRRGNLVWTAAIPIILMVLFIIVMETLHKYFIDIPWIYTLVEGNINLFPNIFVLMIWIIVFALVTLLKIVQRRVSVKRL